jgi:GGDEF domain-containing protein
MARFALRARRIETSGPEARDDWFEHVRLGLPPRFEAVGEALASGTGSAAACAVVGADLARTGASLDETLESLRITYHMVVGREPTFDDTRALSAAWSDITLRYLHQLACEDPMTGLASLAHVRSRLAELFRGALHHPETIRHRYALVVCEISDQALIDWSSADQIGALSGLDRALRLSALGEVARTVFAGPSVIGRLGPDRLVVIAERDERLGQRVGLLRRMANTSSGAESAVRTWIEGLPSTDTVAALLLDELARS